MTSIIRITTLVFVVGCALTILALRVVEWQDLGSSSEIRRSLRFESALLIDQASRGLSSKDTKDSKETMSSRNFTIDRSGEEKRPRHQKVAPTNEISSSVKKTKIQSTGSEYLLDVPFYIYEDLLWMRSGMIGDYTVDEWMKIRKTKHTDDYWFARAALSHPMRTQNPEEAKLFIVPTLLNEVCDQLVWIRRGLCIDDVCDLELVEQADEYLANSQWFRRNQGKDHVVVASHYIAHEILQPFMNLAKCNVIGFEDRRWNAPERLTLPSTYVGNGCKPEPKTHDFALVASMKPRESHRRRTEICSWLQDLDYVGISACGEGEQCPALATAKFGWHVEGDTLGSQRLMDTLLSGTVPIFTNVGQYEILPSWIDWGSISFLADIESHRTFNRFIHYATHDDDSYLYKLDLINNNQNLFDWRTLVPFDTYMYVVARHVVPNSQRRATSSPNSLLLLDKIENMVDPEEFVECGHHYAPSCGFCAPGSRDFLCRGQCQWCEFGATDSIFNRFPGDRCVTKAATCLPEDDLLVQPSDVIYDTEGWENSPVVIEKYKLIFFTTAKVACTTWKQLFRRMMGYKDWNLEGTKDMLPWNPLTNGLKYLYHYDRKTATDMMRSPEWTKAIFLRDPKERILSSFLDKVKKEPEVVWNTCCIEKRDCVTKETTFGDFLQVAFECENEHWSPQFSRMEEKYWEYINFVGYMENIAEDSRRLLQKIGAWEQFGATGWGNDGSMAIFQSQAGSLGRKHATMARERLKQYYTPTLEGKVEEFYKNDYQNPFANLSRNRIF